MFYQLLIHSLSWLFFLVKKHQASFLNNLYSHFQEPPGLPTTGVEEEETGKITKFIATIFEMGLTKFLSFSSIIGNDI